MIMPGSTGVFCDSDDYIGGILIQEDKLLKTESKNYKKMELKDYGDSTWNSPNRWCKW
jgi:hypothetical protein